MNNQYLQWIKSHYPTRDSAIIQCEDATKQMLIAFPELKRVRGLIHVTEPYNTLPTKCPHWWLITKDNKIIDPVAHQYPLGIEKYIEWDESLGEPTGKCMNCGELCHSKQDFCSDKCIDECFGKL